MYVAQFHHPPIMGMYTMYHSLMIILVKDLDIFEVFKKIKEFKALIREPFVDTERGVNQYQVQFKNLFKLILKPFNYIQ
jgi:hypothetical protein